MNFSLPENMTALLQQMAIKTAEAHDGLLPAERRCVGMADLGSYVARILTFAPPPKIANSDLIHAEMMSGDGTCPALDIIRDGKRPTVEIHGREFLDNLANLLRDAGFGRR